jgi:superkiller protein 3
MRLTAVKGDATQALSVAQKAVLTEPARPEARQELATLTLQRGEHGPALAVFAGTRTGDNLDDVRESLGLQAVVESLNPDTVRGKDALRHAQKAIMLSPSQLRNWQILAYVRAQTK